MTHARRTKKQVQANLGLRKAPSDELMALIDAAGDGEFVDGPLPGADARSYAPADIADDVNKGTIGRLVARMRKESGQSLRAAARAVHLTASRIQQIEQSENIEIATLVRLAGAAGYTVQITLNPTKVGQRQLAATLEAIPA